MHLRHLLTLSTLAILALVPAVAQAQDTTVATFERPTEVREHDGALVYSVFDATIDAYRLTVRDTQGARALPVPPAPEPFEADIGTNTAGDPQVVFALDVGAQEGGRAGGKDLMVIALGSGAVRPVSNANTALDEGTPTIDDGRIAFSRIFDDGANPVVYTKRLVAPRERPSARLPGVPERVGRFATTARRVTELELRDGRLGQLVRYFFQESAGSRTNEVRQVELEDRSQRLVAEQSTGENGQFFVGLSFAEGYLSWYTTSLFGNVRGGAYRYRPGRAYRYAEDRLAFLLGFAWTGDGTWQVRANPGGECDAPFTDETEPPCPLVRTGDLAWEIVGADRVR